MISKKIKAHPLLWGLGGVAGLACIAAVAVFGGGPLLYSIRTSVEVTNLPPVTAERVTHGDYLARAGDCVACHTAPGGRPFAGGLDLDTGMGIVRSSNITPDAKTGIGGWNMKQFFFAMRKGLGAHGRWLYPAMPYNDYARISDADLIDLKYFLDTIPPVDHAVEENQMPFPFSIRPLMIGWNVLYLRQGELPEDPAKSADWNRGRYLVDGLGHCTTCHSTKNALGGDVAYLKGQNLQGWFAPDVSGAGWPAVADWNVADIATYLKTGKNRHAIAVGPMAEAIENSTQYLSDADLKAIGIYLKDDAPETQTAAAPFERSAASVPVVNHPEGGRIYATLCATCHADDGKGHDGMAPSLIGDIAILGDNGKDNILRMILAGGRSARTGTYPQGFAMPGFDWKLDDDEVAAVANYVRNNWGNTSSDIQPVDVKAAREIAPVTSEQLR